MTARAEGDAGTAMELLRFGRSEGVPNNPKLPVVLMPDALQAEAGPDEIRALYVANGWGGTWQYTVFDYEHYHTNAHEVLGVASGRADLALGGPGGRTVGVSAGDVLVLPAGTGHRRAHASDDFLVCGGYPPGQEDCDLIRAGKSVPPEHPPRIASVALPETDPICGGGGPLIAAWS